MTAVPILDRYATAWPRHHDAPIVGYASITDAISSAYSTDAHFAAYSCPGVQRRLSSEAPTEIPGGVAMALFVADVDAPNHTATDSWFAAELPKLQALLAAHPGAFVYSSRGGYRVVYRLAQPHVIQDHVGAARWRATYVAWLQYLASRFAIAGDGACDDWTRLYRLPHVVRDGALQVPKTLGDPSLSGTWSVPVVIPEVIVPEPEIALSGSGIVPDEQVRAGAARALATAWPKTGRHFASLSLCGGLAQLGWPEPEIAEFATCVAALANHDDGEPSKRAAQARDSVARVSRGDYVRGWGSLAEHVGDASDRAREALFVPDPTIERARAQARDLLGPKPASTPTATSVRASELVGEIRRLANEPVVYTPWANLNDATQGLTHGSVNVLVGFEGGGKSSFAAQAITHHAERWPAVYYLGEMQARILTARVVGQRLGVGWHDVIRGRVSDAQMRAVLDPLHLYIVPRHLNPIGAILQTVDRARAEVSGPTMVVIDYVQLLAVLGGRSDARTATAAAQRDVQTITEQMDLVTLALSQSSRAGNKRIKEGSENASDLVDVAAETSEFERSATVHMTLSYQPRDDVRTHDVVMGISKRRFGGSTKLGFAYDGLTGLWTATAGPIATGAEKDLRQEILDHVRAHAEGRCIGGHVPCGVGLNQSAFGNKTSAHRIAVKKEKLVAALKALVKAGELVKRGLVYDLPTPNAGGAP